MAFSDLLSSSFLFSIAIIIILIGAIFAYVSYRMSEQDHRISTMLGLVSTMAEEMSFFRSKFTIKEPFKQDIQEPIQEPIKESIDLIPVSDEDSDSDSDPNPDSESESESESELESDKEPDSDSESDEEQEQEQEELNLNNSDNNILNIESLGNYSLDQDLPNIKSIHLEELIDIHDHEPEQDHDHIALNESFSNDIKSISIMDLEEPNKKSNDYKKLSINRLREVVVEKELISDASKLKKPELLKLLEDSAVDE